MVITESAEKTEGAEGEKLVCDFLKKSYRKLEKREKHLVFLVWFVINLSQIGTNWIH